MLAALLELPAEALAELVTDQLLEAACGDGFWDLGFRVWGLRFRVWGSGFRV